MWHAAGKDERTFAKSSASRDTAMPSTDATLLTEQEPMLAESPPQAINPLWKTRLCSFYATTGCRHSSLCTFAHGKEELRHTPDFTRTSICPWMLKHGVCSEALRNNCQYAHNRAELRAVPGLMKTRMCVFYRRGACIASGACRFAHEVTELTGAATAWHDASILFAQTGSLEEVSQEDPKERSPEPSRRITSWPASPVPSFKNPEDNFSKKKSASMQNMSDISCLEYMPPWPSRLTSKQPVPRPGREFMPFEGLVDSQGASHEEPSRTSRASTEHSDEHGKTQQDLAMLVLRDLKARTGRLEKASEDSEIDDMLRQIVQQGTDEMGSLQQKLEQDKLVMPFFHLQGSRDAAFKDAAFKVALLQRWNSLLPAERSLVLAGLQQQAAVQGPNAGCASTKKKNLTRHPRRKRTACDEHLARREVESYGAPDSGGVSFQKLTDLARLSTELQSSGFTAYQLQQVILQPTIVIRDRSAPFKQQPARRHGQV